MAEAVSAQSNSKRPNILLVTPDQMRADAMGCMGNPVVKTPNLDALAAGGVLFRHGYVQNPVCCPSRASFITGQYNHVNGVRDNGFDFHQGLPLLPELLKNAGYRTVSVGKMHFEPIDAPMGFEVRRIAEDKSGNYNDHYRAYLAEKGLRHLSPDVMWKTPNSGALLGMTSPLSEEDYIDTWCGREAIDQIRKSDDRPWFMWIGFPSPHVSTDPPVPFDTMYSKEEVIPPPVCPEEWETKPPIYKGRLDFGEDGIRHFLAHYYGMVSLIDKQMGEIVRTLKEKGQYENTLIIFSSDHGDYAGEHGKIFKGHCLYDALLHVPYIVHWPAGGFQGGVVSDALVESVDVLSTCMDAAGAPVPWGAQGRSIMPLLKGEKEKVRDFAFAEYFNQKMIRTHDWKLIYHVGQPYGELFNLKEDPNEFHNRYDDPKCWEVRDAMMRQLLDHLVATENPMPEASGYWKASSQKNLQDTLREPGRGSL